MRIAIPFPPRSLLRAIVPPCRAAAYAGRRLADLAWLPSRSWRLDKPRHRLKHETPHLQRAPSEYIRRQMWRATQPMKEPQPHVSPVRDNGRMGRGVEGENPNDRTARKRRRSARCVAVPPGPRFARTCPPPPEACYAVPGGRRRTGASPTRSGPEGSSRNEFPPGSLSDLPLPAYACAFDACWQAGTMRQRRLRHRPLRHRCAQSPDARPDTERS